MDCVTCGSSAVVERPERTARGCCRFRCRTCGKQYNKRSGGLLNYTQHPSDVIALVVLWRLRYRLTPRELAEMFLVRGIIFSHEPSASGRRSWHRCWPMSSASAVTVSAAPAAAAGTGARHI
jgi:hypothetical protein